MEVSVAESNAWNALAACGIQRAPELSDEFLIDTFAELIKRADASQAWSPAELDEKSNKQRIVRSLRSLNLQRYLSTPQHVNPQLRQKVLACLEALATAVRSKSTENVQAQATLTTTPAKIFAPSHSLVRTPRREAAETGPEKENRPEVEARVALLASGAAPASPALQTPTVRAARPSTPAPQRPVVAIVPKTPVIAHQSPAPAAAPSTPAARPMAESTVFKRSNKLVRTPVGDRRKTGMTTRPPSPTLELTSRLEQLAITVPIDVVHQHAAALTPAVRRSPRRFRAPTSPTEPAALPTPSATSTLTLTLSASNTQQLAAVLIEKERNYVAKELLGINKALVSAKQKEQQLEEDHQELQEQLTLMRERQAAILAMLKEEGLLDHLSAPNTPAATSSLTTDHHLRTLKEKQLALEERLNVQQRILCDSADRGALIADMTGNIAEYTAVLVQITEHINTRRNTAAITKSIRVPVLVAEPTPSVSATQHTSSSMSIVATSAEEELTYQHEVQFDVQPPVGNVRVPRVLAIERVGVLQSTYIEACKTARAQLAVERQRMLEESAQIMRQMRRNL